MELLASPLGFFIGLTLGSVGAGGSIIAVPILVYAAGLDAKSATTASLTIVVPLAIAGIVTHWRARRVRVVPGVIFGLVGIGGSVGGSHLNRTVGSDVLLLAFAGMMVVAAWALAYHGRWRPFDGGSVISQQPLSNAPSILSWAGVSKITLAGSTMGFVTGFFGVGGGFLIVPILILVLGFTIDEAIGTSLLVITINSIVALHSRLGTEVIPWDVIAPFTLAGLVGVFVGSRLARRIQSVILIRWFAVVVLLIAAYTGVNSILKISL